MNHCDALATELERFGVEIMQCSAEFNGDSWSLSGEAHDRTTHRTGIFRVYIHRQTFEDWFWPCIRHVAKKIMSELSEARDADRGEHTE